MTRGLRKEKENIEVLLYKLIQPLNFPGPQSSPLFSRVAGQDGTDSSQAVESLWK